MNPYNPFITLMNSIISNFKGYTYSGIDSSTGWKVYMIYDKEITDWIENNSVDSWKKDSKTEHYMLSPEIEVLFILRWQ